MSLSRLIARPMLSSIFLVGPVSTWKNAEAIAPSVEHVTRPANNVLQTVGLPPQRGAIFIRANAAVQVAAGLALATGRCPRISAAVLAASLIPTTIGGHSFWDEQEPEGRAQQKIQFAKNLSLVGGLLIAARDTDGRPGLAWRARRAAKDARREARTLARHARDEARVVQAKAS